MIASFVKPFFITQNQIFLWILIEKPRPGFSCPFKCLHAKCVMLMVQIKVTFYLRIKRNNKTQQVVQQTNSSLQSHAVHYINHHRS